jgi:DNA-binding response OmpR family regulator
MPEANAGNVLVLDDDRQILDLLSLVLERGGYNVSKAEAPEEALKILTEGRVELLILDVNLPGVSGMDFLKMVKCEHPYIETVVVSGDSQLEDAVSFIRAGAFDFLTKPVSNKRLLEKAAAALHFRKERLETDLAKTAQFMVEERPLAKYVLVKQLPSITPLCECSLLEHDFDSFLLNSYKRLAEMSARPEELAANFLKTVQRVQTAVEHPNVVKIIEHGFQDNGDRPYVVLENLKGRPLSELLSMKMDMHTRLRIARQIASAIAKLHESSILIGALSAKLIFVEDDTYNVKLSDFGLAFLFGFEARKLDKNLAPDPFFMAPELLDGLKDAPDPKADVFSLGAMLYAILCGKTSFPTTGKTPELPPFRELSPKTGKAMTLLLGSMLQREPSQRIDSDEALSSLNVISTMPDMLDTVIERYDTEANRGVWS